jgi:hypothetical protein
MSTINRVGAGTASCTGTGATSTATLANRFGKLTTAALTTAAGATHVITVTNSAVKAADLAFASVKYGSASTGSPVVTAVTPGASSLVIEIQNVHASAAVNGTLIVDYAVFGA